MQDGSYLINVARGSVVEDAALVGALKSGKIGGAGLDVTEIEPLAATSLLSDNPNAIITPHVGAQSFSRVDDSTHLACVNLKRFLAVEKPYNLVDKRQAGQCEAVILKEDAKASGSIVLPDSAPDDFIAEFNRTYASIGWTVESIRPPIKR